MKSKPFPGFPAKVLVTPVPNIFFGALLPRIDDLVELKVTLQAIFILAQRRGYPKFVTFKRLATDRDFLSGLGAPEEKVGSVLQQGLAAAVSRGTLLQTSVEHNGQIDELFFLNTESNRQAICKIVAGQFDVRPLISPVAPLPALEQPNIFVLYEQNIGMLTPLIADELKDAEKNYPAPWIVDAFREAVAANRRSWRYVLRILERWERDGKQDGKPGGHSKAKTDPESYFRGEFGHLIKG